MAFLNLNVVTPEGKIFEGDAAGVQVPGTLGSFEVLYNHAAIVSILDTGILNITLPDSSKKTFNISGGVVEVMDNKVIVLVEKVVEA